MSVSINRTKFIKLLKSMDIQIRGHNFERLKEDLVGVGKLEVTILGQFSLFINEEAYQNLPLALTADFDALIEGHWLLKKEFKDAINKFGFVYDELSKEIWIPAESKFDLIYESENLLVKSIQPVFCLLSKAIKAPEKNKILIREAKLFYKDKLNSLIKKYNEK